MALATLSIDLEARLGKLQSSLDKAGRIAEKDSARMSRAFDKARVAAGAIGVALLGGLSAAAVTRFVKGSIDGADAAIKQARAVGVLTEEITALNFAAELSGVSQEQLTGGLSRLARNAKDAGDGVKTSVDAFSQLGISVTGADGQLKGTTELLGEIADRFQQLPDGIQKTAAAQELFGRSGASLINLLNGGSKGLEDFREEAERLGLVLNTETAQAAELFNDNMTRLGKLTTGAANNLTTALLPVLVDLSQIFVDVNRSTNEVGDGFSRAGVAAGGLKTVLETVLVVGANVSFVLSAVGREIGAIAAQTVALGQLDIAGFRAISDAVKEDGARARAELDAFEARVFALGTGTQPVGSVARPSAPAGAGGGASGGGSGVRGSSSAVAFKEQQRLLSFTITNFGEDEAEAETKRLQRYADVLAALPQRIVPVQTAQEEMVQAFLRSEKAAYDLDLTPVIEQFEKLDARTEQFENNVQNALGDTILATFKGSTDNLLDLWSNMLQRMVAEALAADLVSALTGKGEGGNLASLGGSFLKVIGGLFGGGRAIGGQARRGQIVEVNEFGGPGEIFSAGGRQYLLPSADGVVMPTAQRAPAPQASVRGSAAASVSVSMASPQIYIDARSDAAQVAQMVASGMSQAQENMWRQLRARGLV